MTEELIGTFWDHIAAFRQTFIKCLAAILMGVCISFYFHQDILQFLKAPLTENAPSFLNSDIWPRQEIRQERIKNTGSTTRIYSLGPLSGEPIRTSPGVIPLTPSKYQIPPGGYIDVEKVYYPSDQLAILGPLEGIIPIFKMSVWMGMVFTSPLWLYSLFGFVQPALHAEEKKLLLPFLGLSFIFLFLGCAFGFYVVIPIANHYFATFNSSLGLNMWTLSNYLNYTLCLGLACALAFELSMIIFLLVHYRFISTDTLVAKRRHMMVTAFILGALLTPPDVITQVALALPLIGLYEIAIIYSRFRHSKIILPEHG